MLSVMIGCLQRIADATEIIARPIKVAESRRRAAEEARERAQTSAFYNIVIPLSNELMGLVKDRLAPLCLPTGYATRIARAAAYDGYRAKSHEGFASCEHIKRADELLRGRIEAVRSIVDGDRVALTEFVRTLEGIGPKTMAAVSGIPCPRPAGAVA